MKSPVVVLKATLCKWLAWTVSCDLHSKVPSGFVTLPEAKYVRMETKGRTVRQEGSRVSPA